MVLEQEEERYINVRVSSIQWSNLIWWILHCTVHVKYAHFRKVSHFSVRCFKCYPSLLHNIYILCEKPPSWELKVKVSNIQFMCSLYSLQEGWFKVYSIVCSMFIYIYCYSCYHEPCLIATTRAEKVGELLHWKYLLLAEID